jgi:hypothetical protein
MRHLRSLALCAAALACLVPAQAFASQARIDGLGLQSDYVQDYVNVIHYPSTIVRYQNLVYGDLGIKDESGGDLSEFEDHDSDVPELQNSARSMGAFLKLWKGMPGVFGVQLDENANPFSPAYGAEYWNRNRNQSFSLLWGHEFGSMAFGLQVNRSHSSLESGPVLSEPFPYAPGTVTAGSGSTREIMNSINAQLGLEPRNSFGIGGGLTFGWDAYGRRHSADVAVQYRTLDLEQSAGAPGATVVLEDNGNSALAINARSQFATSDNTYLTPVINYWRLDMGSQLTDEATPANDFDYENTITGWNVGLAESWVLREQDLLTLGFAVGNQEIEYEDPTRTVAALPFEIQYSTTPQIFGAAEIHPMNWLHLRFGASKSLMSKLEIEQGTTATEIKDSPLGYTVGLGFRIGGRVDLDAVLNQDFPFTGGWFASGQEETPFSRLSATYRF